MWEQFTVLVEDMTEHVSFEEAKQISFFVCKKQKVST